MDIRTPLIGLLALGLMATPSSWADDVNEDGTTGAVVTEEPRADALRCRVVIVAPPGAERPPLPEGLPADCAVDVREAPAGADGALPWPHPLPADGCFVVARAPPPAPAAGATGDEAGQAAGDEDEAGHEAGVVKARRVVIVRHAAPDGATGAGAPAEGEACPLPFHPDGAMPFEARCDAIVPEGLPAGLPEHAPPLPMCGAGAPLAVRVIRAPFPHPGELCVTGEGAAAGVAGADTPAGPAEESPASA